MWGGVGETVALGDKWLGGKNVFTNRLIKH